MSSERAHDEPTPLDAAPLVVLDRISQPIWIADIDLWRYRWANRAGLAFWKASSVEELVARRAEASETMRETFFHLRRRALRDGSVRADHTVYPDGHPVRIQSVCTPHPLPEGRVGLFIEAQLVKAEVDPEVIRRSEAVRYAPLIVTTHALDGTTLAANALARSTLGSHFSLADLTGSASAASELVEKLREGGHVSHDAFVQTTRGPRWLAIEARRIPDPVTGADAVVVSAHDVTARREAELAKDDLLGVVSHELRTPLTAIRGALAFLANRKELGLEHAEPELLEIATDNTNRLTQLLDDLLDVQKLGAGALDLSFEDVALQGVIDRSVVLVSPLAQASGARIVVSAPSEPIVVHVDQGRIVQVLSNLLSNAIKHSPPRGTVRIRVDLTASGSRVRVNVIDEGPGVPVEFRERIFGRFAQADTSSGRKTSGVGLGLHIAKKLVERHGGALGFEPDRPRGAAFHFDLPLVDRAAR